MLPVEAVPPRSLQPYPDDPTQDIVVNHMVTAANVLNKVTTVIGFPFELISKAYSSFKELNSCTHAHERLIVRPTLPGEAGKPTYAKVKNLAYDNKFDYLIHGGKAWFRPIGYSKEAKWRELGPNGNPSNQPLVGVSADGDNVIVWDDLDRIWYAKTTGIEVIVSFDCPKWRVVKEEIEWILQFYTFPVVSTISNYFNHSIITTTGLKNIFVSHKGVETLYYTDLSGKKIVDSFLGTSMVGGLGNNGIGYFLIDPYVRQRRMEIVGPENGRFVSDALAVSASTWMTIQRGRRADGSTFNHCYTIYKEPDLLFTAYPHTYDPNNRTPMIRFFPSENWLKQPHIPMTEKTRLTTRIGIMQTGCGQSQRILFWEGTHPDGKTTGFYAKFIYDPNWRFIPTNHEINPDDYLTVEGMRQGPKIAFDYSSDFTSDIVKNVRLNNFISVNMTERAPKTAIEMILHNQQRYTLRLHQLKGLKYVFGLSDTDDHWTLIPPRDLNNSPEVRAAHQWVMGEATSLQVTVEESEGRVRVFYPGRFDFTFNREEEQEGCMPSSLLGLQPV